MILLHAPLQRRAQGTGQTDGLRAGAEAPLLMSTVADGL